METTGSQNISNILGNDTVRRRIQFFRLWASCNADNVPKRLNPIELCNAIGEIHSSPARYWTDSEETETTAWLYSNQRDRFILATIKRKDLPLIEEDGVSERLQLAIGKGIAEAIHVRIFPNNVIGAEYNDRGPRLPRLKYFLGNKRRSDYQNMQIVPLLDKDTRGRLKQLKDVSLLEFIISEPTFSAGDGSKHYMQDLHNLFAVADAGVLAISMRPAKRKSKLNQEAAVEFAESMLDDQQTANALRKMSVRGYDPSTKASALIDLLGERIVASHRILRMNPTSRAADSDDAFRAIGEAYNEVKARIPLVTLADE